MNYTKKAVTGAGIVFVFAILAAFFGYLFRLVLVRNLPVSEYGLFNAVFAFISLLWIFKDLGLGEALSKYIPEFKIKREYEAIKNSLIISFGFQLLLSGILAILLMIFSKTLAVHYFHNPPAAILINIFTVYLLLKPIVLVCSSAFQGFQNMKYHASIDLLRSILVLVIMLIGFNVVKNVTVPTFAYVLTTLILVLIYVPLLIKKTFPQFSKVKFSFDKVLIKKLFKFGFPAMLGGASWFVMTYMATAILTYFSGLEQVGLYNAAFPTVNLLQYFGLALAAVLLPMTSELWVGNKKEQLIQGIRLLYHYSFLLVIPLALIMFLFSDLLLRLLFGVNYIIAGNTLKILTPSVIFFILAKVNSSILSGIGKPKLNAKTMWATATLSIILNFSLIPPFGIIGAAIATSSSFLIMFILSTIYLKKNISIKIPVLIWSKIFLLGAIFVGTVLYLKSLFALTPIFEAFLVIVIAGGIYIILSFAFKVISLKEIRHLLKSLKS